MAHSETDNDEIVVGSIPSTLPSLESSNRWRMLESVAVSKTERRADDSITGVANLKGNVSVWLETIEFETEEVDRDVALLSPYIMREVVKNGKGKAMDDPVVLPKAVNQEILSLLIEYCRFHRVTGRSDKERKLFDEKFVRLDTRKLCELTSAADSLELKPLVDLTSRALARMIEGKTPEEIRETFHLPDDLTEEEKLEPVKNMSDDPRIRLLNRLYARKRKELQEKKLLKSVSTDQNEKTIDDRSVDDLLSFIDGPVQEVKSGKSGKGKKKKKKPRRGAMAAMKGEAQELADREWREEETSHAALVETLSNTLLESSHAPESDLWSAGPPQPGDEPPGPCMPLQQEVKKTEVSEGDVEDFARILQIGLGNHDDSWEPSTSASSANPLHKPPEDVHPMSARLSGVSMHHSSLPAESQQTQFMQGLLTRSNGGSLQYPHQWPTHLDRVSCLTANNSFSEPSSNSDPFSAVNWGLSFDSAPPAWQPSSHNSFMPGGSGRETGTRFGGADPDPHLPHLSDWTAVSSPHSKTYPSFNQPLSSFEPLLKWGTNEQHLKQLSPTDWAPSPPLISPSSVPRFSSMASSPEDVTEIAGFLQSVIETLGFENQIRVALKEPPDSAGDVTVSCRSSNSSSCSTGSGVAVPATSSGVPSNEWLVEQQQQKQNGGAGAIPSLPLKPSVEPGHIHMSHQLPSGPFISLNVTYLKKSSTFYV